MSLLDRLNKVMRKINQDHPKSSPKDHVCITLGNQLDFAGGISPTSWPDFSGYGDFPAFPKWHNHLVILGH